MVDNIGAFVYKYPEDEWFDARVNMHCRVSDLSILKEVMKRKGMLRRWEHGVFGQFIGMGKGKQFFSGKLCHLLLCREEDHVHTSAMPNFTPPVADRAEEPDIADRAEESDKHRHIVEESITDKLNGKRVRRPSAAIRTPYTVPRHVKEIVYARKKGTKGKPNDNADFGQ